MRSYLISPMAVGLEFRLGWGCELSRPMQYAECSRICSLSHEPHPAGASSGLRSEFRRNKSKRRLLRALTCSNHWKHLGPFCFMLCGAIYLVVVRALQMKQKRALCRSSSRNAPETWSFFFLICRIPGEACCGRRIISVFLLGLKGRIHTLKSCVTGAGNISDTSRMERWRPIEINTKGINIDW